MGIREIENKLHLVKGTLLPMATTVVGGVGMFGSAIACLVDPSNAAIAVAITSIFITAGGCISTVCLHAKNQVSTEKPNTNSSDQDAQVLVHVQAPDPASPPPQVKASAPPQVEEPPPSPLAPGAVYDMITPDPSPRPASTDYLMPPPASNNKKFNYTSPRNNS
jgi:hypothetical protein